MKYFYFILFIFCAQKIVFSQTTTKIYEKDTNYILNCINNIKNNLSENYDTSNINLEEILILSQELNYYYGEYFVYNYLFKYFYFKGNYDKSIYYANKSLEIANKLNIPSYKGEAFLNLFESTDKAKDYQTAKKYLFSAISIFSNLQDSSKLMICNLKMSFLSYDLQQFDSCGFYSGEAIRQSLELNDYEHYISALLMQSGAFTKLLDYNSAEKNILEALNTYKKFNVSYDESEIYMGLAHLYYFWKKYDKAIQNGLISYNLAKQDSITRHLWLNADILSKSYYELGDYKNGYCYLDSCKLYQFQIFDKEKINFVNELNTKYFTEQKEAENTYLTKINLQKTRTIYILIVLLILIFTLGLIVYIYKTQK